MNRILVNTMVVMGALVMGAAWAADDGSAKGAKRGNAPSAEERFKTADTDADGKISLQEYTAAIAAMRGRQGGGNSSGKSGGQNTQARVEERFKALDTNKDGFLSTQEFAASRSQGNSGSRKRDGSGKSQGNTPGGAT